MTLRKVFSGILTFCMLVSLLTCVSILPASAAGTTPDLIKISGDNNANNRLQYTKTWSTIAAGNYRFEMDCKIFSGTPVISVGKDETGELQSWQSDYVSYYDEANCKYIITFTVASDWSGNLGVRVGNYYQSSPAEFEFANPTLYLLDADGNPTGSSLINTFASDYYSTSRTGNKWNRPVKDKMTVSTYTAGYFNKYKPQLVEIKDDSNANNRLQYTKGWSTIAAGNYRFEMDCKIYSGTPVIRVGKDETGELQSWQSDYVSYYDEANCKYIITFTVASDWSGNLGVMIGNYYNAEPADFACANPTLYLLDADGNPTGSSLINTFASDYYSTSRTGNKWNKKVVNKMTFTCPIPDGYFDPVFIPFCGGDTNEDGAVDVRDLVRYKKIMAGILTTELSLDANQDDKVDATDLSLMRQILLNTGKSSMLYNTYYKLNYTKSLNISYIGGSVTGAVGASTDENGWAFLVTKYLKQKYPNANITESNMGVGGTGSYLGMARFNNNIIENKPDLLFIEFAINDRYNDIPEEQTKQNIEYMINSVYKSNPYADIVFVLITDKNVIGTEFESLKTIKSVAEYYGLPTVDVGQAMWKELNGSIDNWDEYYSDGVHPSDAGHKVYADTVFEKMEEIMINGGKLKCKLPEETMCENGFTNVELLTRDTFGPFKWGTLDDEVYGAYWWFDSDVYEKSGCPLRTSYARCFSKILPKYIYPKYDGATLEFTVTGNNIGIIGTIKEGQSITVTLDGNETKTINGTSNVTMTEYPLWNSLENTEHTVKIVANGDGPYIALAAVVVGN